MHFFGRFLQIFAGKLTKNWHTFYWLNIIEYYQAVWTIHWIFFQPFKVNILLKHNDKFISYYIFFLEFFLAVTNHASNSSKTFNDICTCNKLLTTQFRSVSNSKSVWILPSVCGRVIINSVCVSCSVFPDVSALVVISKLNTKWFILHEITREFPIRTETVVIRVWRRYQFEIFFQRNANRMLSISWDCQNFVLWWNSCCYS